MGVMVNFILVAGMIAPMFVICLFYFISSVRELNAKWRANQERRRARKARNNVRILFDAKGVVFKESLTNVAQMQLLEHIIRLLHTLANKHTFGNPTLYRFHKNLKLADEVAERCSDAAHNFLCRKGGADPQYTRSFAPVERVLEDLGDRVEPSGDPVAVLNSFKEELAVLYAAFGVGCPADAQGAVTEALLGQAKSSSIFGGIASPAVPDFPSSPVAQLTKRAKSLNRATRGGDGSEAVVQADHLEPQAVVDGVYARGSGLLFWAVELRDKYGLGSRRQLLVLVAVLLAVGPVRFLGTVPAVAFAVVLSVELLLDILRACEAASFSGCAGAVRRSFFRVAGVVLLGAMVAVPLSKNQLEPPQSIQQLEAKPTFLPVPPQYRFRASGGPTPPTYVPTIYGIMHAVLAILCLIPLPVCYGLQARFVEAFPGLRFMLPQNPVWMHRMLGYMMVAGLISAAMVWLVFQGGECLVRGEVTCTAFFPNNAIGKEVFLLRFHIVWPLAFFFIPLMIYDRYPEASDESAKAPSPEPQGEAAASEDGRAAKRGFFSWARKDKKSARSGGGEGARLLETGSGEPARGAVIGEAEPTKNQSTKSVVLQFLYRRFHEVCLCVVVVAGNLLMLQEESLFIALPVPLWPVIAVFLLAHLGLKFRDFVKTQVGEVCKSAGCLDIGEEWSEFFRRSWWEMAYASHTIAFMIMLVKALQIRFEVFWPALFTWGLYFLDRGLGLMCACKNEAPIVVSEGVSSYAVSSQDGAKADPSHVRLVLKKPPGFKYKAGQWCHLALQPCGSYLRLPSWCLPFLQWHAFSIASTELDEHLEFHIAVHGTRGYLGRETGVRVVPVNQHTLKLVRFGRWLDCLFGLRVPYFGAMPDAGNTGTQYTLETSGVYLNLTREGGASIKCLKPQVQWTGRLWNTVQWLLESQGGNSGNAPEQVMRIMGPYGHMPHTCEGNPAVMLIGAGVGFPSTGAMLRRVLESNMSRPDEEKQAVCFIWTATKVDQLLLCFPSLLVDLTKYVHKRSLDDLKKWLHVKIFISSFEGDDFLSINPGPHLFPDSKTMVKSLQEVRLWLLGKEVTHTSESYSTHDEDGTYIAQGSLPASFADILRCSLFTRKVVERKSPLGICFCGPTNLCNSIRSDVANTILPVKVEFSTECAGAS